MSYKVINITTFAQARKYGKVNDLTTRWEFTHQSKTYYDDSVEILTHYGHKIFIFLRDGYVDEEVPVEHGGNTVCLNKKWDRVHFDHVHSFAVKADNFGLSMIAILVNQSGKLLSSMTRYDKQFDNKYITEKQLNNVLKANFRNYISDYLVSKESVLNDVKQMFADAKRAGKLTDILNSFSKNTQNEYFPVILSSIQERTPYYMPYVVICNRNGDLLVDMLFDLDHYSSITQFETFGHIKIMKVFLNDKYYIIKEDGTFLNKTGYDEIYWYKDNDVFTKQGRLLATLKIKYKTSTRCVYNILDEDGFCLLPDWTIDYIRSKKGGWADCGANGIVRVKLMDKVWKIHHNLYNINKQEYVFDIDNQIHCLMNLKGSEYEPTGSDEYVPAMDNFVLVKSYDGFVWSAKELYNIYNIELCKYILKEPVNSSDCLFLNDFIEDVDNNLIEVSSNDGDFLYYVNASGEMFDQDKNKIDEA